MKGKLISEIKFQKLLILIPPQKSPNGCSLKRELDAITSECKRACHGISPGRVADSPMTINGTFVGVNEIRGDALTGLFTKLFRNFLTLRMPLLNFSEYPRRFLTLFPFPSGLSSATIFEPHSPLASKRKGFLKYN